MRVAQVMWYGLLRGDGWGAQGRGGGVGSWRRLVARAPAAPFVRPPCPPRWLWPALLPHQDGGRRVGAGALSAAGRCFVSGPLSRGSRHRGSPGRRLKWVPLIVFFFFVFTD